MNLILTGNEIDTALKALEIYIAMHLGRYRDISTLYRFDCEPERYEEAVAYEQGRENVLLLIRNRLMPELAMFSLRSANRGIYQDLVDDRARDAYDLLQVIRHADAWFRKPEGGIGNSFFTPLFSGRFEASSCDVKEKNGAETMNVALCSEQLAIMIEAAAVYNHVLHGRMCQALEYYTTDAEALEMAGEIEPLFPHVVRKDLIERADSFLEYLRGIPKEHGMHEKSVEVNDTK